MLKKVILTLRRAFLNKLDYGTIVLIPIQLEDAGDY
jgi:hypothetical protein